MTDKFPKYIRLKKDNPYRDDRVVCNGFCVTYKKPIYIANKTMLDKLYLIKDYIEEIEL